MRRLFIYIFLIGLISCSDSEDKGEVLAEVNNMELFESDLENYLVEQGTSEEDSSVIANEFIQTWINDQILMQAAEENSSIDKDRIDRKVEKFKKEMYILEMEQMLVDEKLDTNISDDEIKNYYDEHEDQFHLNDYLVKVLYIKVPVDAPDINKITYKYKLYNDSDIEEIEIYAKIYASNYYYDEENWIYFDDLLKEIPLHDINKDSFIMKRSKIRFEENGYHYFLNILDYKLKNTLSPLSFEKNNIKERILNMRIKELRETIKSDIINKAYESNSVTVYK